MCLQATRLFSRVLCLLLHHQSGLQAPPPPRSVAEMTVLPPSIQSSRRMVTGVKVISTCFAASAHAMSQQRLYAQQGDVCQNTRNICGDSKQWHAAAACSNPPPPPLPLPPAPPSPCSHSVPPSHCQNFLLSVAAANTSGDIAASIDAAKWLMQVAFSIHNRAPNP